MKKERIVQLHNNFEQLLHKEGDRGIEFWLAQDLQKVLGYDCWENFEKVERGIVPERLPPSEDIKKVERRVESEQKKLPKQIKSLESDDISQE